MSRYDKYNPKSGGFRALLAEGWTDADVGVVTGVGLDGNGHVVKGAGNTGIVGVLVVDTPKPAAEPVDVMTAGDIVDVGLAPGTVYYADAATGAVEPTAPAAGVNKAQVGWTVEASRLVVRTEQVQG